MGKPLKSFDNILKDFLPREVKSYPYMGDKIELPAQLPRFSPFVIFIIFVHLKRFDHWGKADKRLWTIAITYKEISFNLADTKYGFRWYCEAVATNEIIDIAHEAMLRISKAIPLAEALFQPEVDSLIAKGNVSLENQFEEIHKRYLFFRELAKEKFQSAAEQNAFTFSLEKPLGNWEKALKDLNAGQYFTSAMLDAYFSLIEHTFVLITPFIAHLEWQSFNLKEHIRQNWKDKIKRILPLDNDKQISSIIEALTKIKEELRNPMNHGFFLKDGQSFRVHLDHIGAIPMLMTTRGNHLIYNFNHTFESPFYEVCGVFDSFMNYLEKSEVTKFGMRFLKSDLYVLFMPKVVELYRAYMTSEEKFEEVISYFQNVVDQRTDMDWF